MVLVGRWVVALFGYIFLVFKKNEEGEAVGEKTRQAGRRCTTQWKATDVHCCHFQLFSVLCVGARFFTFGPAFSFELVLLVAFKLLLLSYVCVCLLDADHPAKRRTHGIAWASRAQSRQHVQIEHIR